MNPSHFRIKLPKQDAMRRFSDWMKLPELVPPVEVDSLRAIEMACDEAGRWKGCALFVYENQGWTVFEDLTGMFSARDSKEWITFAGNHDFVFAGYNDAIGYGELIVIKARQVIREFFEDLNSGEESRDYGLLPVEGSKPIQSWVDVAAYVDQDSIAYAEKGELWLLRNGSNAI
jgi:hypothetical protein